MSKTPEELAEEAIRWVKTLPPASERCNQCACEGYRAGYKAGSEITEQEIADIIVDIRKREEEERKKLPAHKQQRHDRIWEKIKVKIIGVF